MIIELFGLPGSGKTALAEAMKEEGAMLVPMPSRTRLIFDAGLFWLLHPLLALKLLAHIMRAPHTMRYALFMNGYVGYAARYRRAQALSRAGAIVVLDQGFFQLIISLDGLPLALLKIFPKPDLLVVVTVGISERERRMTFRGWAPREKSGTENRLAWQRSAETALHNTLPSLETLMWVHRYDGTRNPQEGAAMLMALAAKQSRTTVRISSTRNLLKTILALVSFLVAQVARIFQSTQQVVVLMYHAVDRSGWKLAVSPEVFERQMKYIVRKGWAVSLTDVVSYAKVDKKLSAHAAAITFDDGYRDLLTTVLPILERYSIPATVFISSDLSIRTDPTGTPRLTEEELRTLARSPFITIGSHAKTHTKFVGLSSEEMYREAKESADTLERISGKRPIFFAYPFGARSTDAERAVKDAGYEAAFGITEGTIHQGDNLFRLKRVQIDGTTSHLLFRLRLTHAVDLNRRIVDALRAMMPV
jgi:peptidoglycan/xylan/chitin deacetylase (PgdA/CDA1 family)